MSMDVARQEVRDGVVAYSKGHFNIALNHFSYARNVSRRSRLSADSDEVLLRLYWLKALAANTVKLRSRFRLVRAIMRRTRITNTHYIFRAIAIACLGASYNRKDDSRYLAKDLSTLTL